MNKRKNRFLDFVKGCFYFDDICNSRVYWNQRSNYR